MSTTPTSQCATPRRPPPLPAVKGTMGGIETPRRDIFSPAQEAFRSAPPTPTTPSVVHPPSDAPERERVTFRADPRMATCFERLPEGSAEIRGLFGV